jgi:hypothetical protein
MKNDEGRKLKAPATFLVRAGIPSSKETFLHRQKVNPPESKYCTSLLILLRLDIPDFLRYRIVGRLLQSVIVAS